MSPHCLANTAFLSIGSEVQRTFEFKLRVTSDEQTNVVSRAKSAAKESGDESPHSKGRSIEVRGQSRFGNKRPRGIVFDAPTRTVANQRIALLINFGSRSHFQSCRTSQLLSTQHANDDVFVRDAGKIPPAKSC